MIDFVWWGVLPYIVLTIFIGGHIYRYQRDQFGWSTKSSEFLDKKSIRVGVQLFHWGILIVFGGHFLGLIVPVGLYNSLGISEHLYHTVALVFGIPAGIAAFIGLILLYWRRLTVKRIKATSSKGDWAVLFFLLLVIGSGLSATFANIDANGFDYRTTIAPWLRGLFVFHVQPELMAGVPVWFKVHITAFYGIAVVWPFTRLVHVFSLPLRYMRRNYVVYRSRTRKA
ncbi:respiratory nitrate reductase subunit gamma [Virgibacillus dakarensis]|nr:MULTISPECIES: respiratory nitrate reductase subunit gamma [Bacillaceae]MBT2217394.1 respiratory nitrate reductase subunit gamma [Virgibacillus dakarensis]MTW87015.1 respiratory nitrate reductase subunit gamma [Virgibacillus dakarensis]